MSTTAGQPRTPAPDSGEPSAPVPVPDPAPPADPGMQSGALGDIRKFLDDGGADVPGPDAPIGEIAVSRGYLTEEQLEECLAEQARTTPHVLLGELLLRRKYITNEQLLRALAVQKKPAPPVQLPDGARIGKYALIRELGRGGMGVVYEAEDPDLRRRVAIKVLKEDSNDPAAAERLRREAAIAAQLRHPGIVSIHEVGSTTPLQGPALPFIAMDFVQGRTLAAILEEKKAMRADLLKVLEDVARAVAHAHAHGVVHRDLKPANVLVDSFGRAMLTDFGIARATSFQTRITETSFVVGTPEYMAPEQIEGRRESLGPATDIHALGVMLYEILTGRLPYRAESPVALLRKILTEEPVPPRKLAPSVESDLEIICLKALEKEGNRRYASADAFAEDLQRFRTGKRIRARVSGPVSKMWRKIVQRKTASIAVASGLAIAAGTAIVLAAWARSERAEAVRQLTDRMETDLRATLELRRVGDLDRMKAFARRAQEACASASAAYPGLAEPHALLGRMHRALMDYDRALEEQQAALERNPDCPRALYERIVLTARLLRRREDELTERAWRSLGEKIVRERTGPVRAEDVAVPPRDQLAAADATSRGLRERLQADLTRLEDAGADSVGPGELPCAQGLVRRNRRSLQAAVEKSPFLEEAIEALALLEQDAGNYEKAIAAWTSGVDHDHGYLPHLEGRGDARLNWGYQKLLRGEDPSGTLIAAIGDFAKVLEKDPRRDQALRQRGLAHFLLGQAIGWVRPEDATHQYQSAEEDLSHALELNPKAAPTWMWRGVVRTALAVGKLILLQDAMPLCKDAISDLTEAIRRNPEADEPYLWRAITRIPWAVQLYVKGQDAEFLYREALADFERALKLNPGRGETWLWRSTVHAAWAGFLITRGKNATEILRTASSDAAVATQKIPGGTEAPSRRGAVELLLGLQPGEDAATHDQAALEAYEVVLSRNAKSSSGLEGRGLSRARLAYEKARSKRIDPTPAFETAFRDLDDAVKQDPAARLARAQANLLRGQWKSDAGKEPDADYQAALADLKGALEANLLLADGWMWLGRAKTLTAGSRPLPGLAYQEAINEINKVLLFTPDYVMALRFRGDAHLRRARLNGLRHLDDYRAALADFQRAVRLQPLLAPELEESIAACRAALDKK